MVRKREELNWYYSGGNVLIYTLTARCTCRAGTIGVADVGHSEPGSTEWLVARKTDQRYAGDNRLMTP